MLFKTKMVWLLSSMGIGLFISACPSVCVATQLFNLSFFHQPGDTFMRIRLRGTIELPADKKINGLKLTELSGLAWDEDEGILYAVSDKGYLFHFQPILLKKTLTSIHYHGAYQLRNREGRKLPSRDSEGLALLKGRNGIKGDSELVIAFERVPSVGRFTSTGEWLGNYILPTPLQQIKNYSYRNTALESVTIHPQFGMLTAPEWPLRGNKGKIIIYAQNGQQWAFPHHPAPNSAVVALEALPNGSILVLERAFVSKFRPLIISLRHITLSTCQLNTCPLKKIFIFNNSRGWRIDNFEGLTRYRANTFFMVSDNNDNPFQRTLLNYFEILSY